MGENRRRSLEEHGSFMRQDESLRASLSRHSTGLPTHSALRRVAPQIRATARKTPVAASCYPPQRLPGNHTFGCRRL